MVYNKARVGNPPSNLAQNDLSTCASCKKIRNDEGYWMQVEIYIQDHSEAKFSHGLCPDCARALYPDLELGGG